MECSGNKEKVESTNEMYAKALNDMNYVIQAIANDYMVNILNLRVELANRTK